MPDATAPVGSEPAQGQAEPKRSDVDPTEAPPMPSQLVVPEQKPDATPAPKADAAPAPAPAPTPDAAPAPAPKAAPAPSPAK
jgi:hypothetical protein